MRAASRNLFAGLHRVAVFIMADSVSKPSRARCSDPEPNGEEDATRTGDSRGDFPDRRGGDLFRPWSDRWIRPPGPNRGNDSVQRGPGVLAWIGGVSGAGPWTSHAQRSFDGSKATGGGGRDAVRRSRVQRFAFGPRSVAGHAILRVLRPRELDDGPFLPRVRTADAQSSAGLLTAPASRRRVGVYVA
jgi:hypothetical protein